MIESLSTFLLHELGKAGKSHSNKHLLLMFCSSTSRPSWIGFLTCPFMSWGKPERAGMQFASVRVDLHGRFLLQSLSWVGESRKELENVHSLEYESTFMKGFLSYSFCFLRLNAKVPPRALLSSMPQQVGRLADPGPSYGCTLSIRVILTWNGLRPGDSECL